MPRRTTISPLGLLVALLQLASLAIAEKPEYCKKDNAVAQCVTSVNKYVTRTHVVKKFCSALLKCPPVTTTTLRGTVTKTKTKWVKGSDVPWEEIVRIPSIFQCSAGQGSSLAYAVLRNDDDGDLLVHSES